MKVESYKTHIQKERNLADCQVSFLAGMRICTSVPCPGLLV